MTNLTIDYLIDSEGEPKAVVIPIELWRKLLPQAYGSLEKLTEGLEDYCLSKAMEAAIETPLLNRQEAIEFLEAEDGD